MIDDTRERSGRRGFLGAAALGFAGCIGDGEPEPVDGGGNGGGGGDATDATELRMRTATSTTAAYAANQGLAAAVNENTDSVFIEAQTSPGTEANIGALQSGEAEMVYIQNWSAADVREGVEPFDDLDFTLNQVFHYYDLPWFFCTGGDLESIADIGRYDGVADPARVGDRDRARLRRRRLRTGERGLRRTGQRDERGPPRRGRRHLPQLRDRLRLAPGDDGDRRPAAARGGRTTSSRRGRTTTACSRSRFPARRSRAPRRRRRCGRSPSPTTSSPGTT